MVSIAVINSNIYQFRGLSTDTKPVGATVGNGSEFIEIDTGKIFLYNAEGESGSEWCEIGAEA